MNRIDFPAVAADGTPLSTTSDGRAGVDKVQTLEALAERAAVARARGDTVVLCHGTFDLLHLGHVRHFEQARAHGDVLLVTVTEDRFVNKGPGRPHFAAGPRAEMVGAIACVDGVAISEEASAVGAIGAIKPDYYVKGAEYQDFEQDATGKIRTEYEAVERHGGQLLFTDEVTFSSSSLLNRYFDVFDDDVREYLENVRGVEAIARTRSLIDSVAETDVVLVGETIIDEYSYVDTLGKSAKESIIAAQYHSGEVFAGGVIAAANHLSSLCRKVTIVTCFDQAHPAMEVVKAQLRSNVELSVVQVDGLAPTRKLRFVDQSYMRKMFEVYYMDDTPLGAEHEKALHDRLHTRLSGAGVVVVTDFGHGMISESTVELLIRESRFLAVNAQTNSANQGFNPITRYPKADFVCIDEPELRLACRDKHGDTLRLMRRKLVEMIDCPNIVVTRGRHGCYALQRGSSVADIPAFTTDVIDTLGAGDAFFSVCAPLVAAGGRMDDVGLIGNAAGALKVHIMGHRRPIERIELLNYIKTLLK